MLLQPLVEFFNLHVTLTAGELSPLQQGTSCRLEVNARMIAASLEPLGIVWKRVGCVLGIEPNAIYLSWGCVFSKSAG